MSAKDLLVQSRFRNNILWKLMEGRSAAAVSKEIGVCQTQFGKLLNLKKSPFVKSDPTTPEYCFDCLKIAAHFHYLPEDLFPATLYSLSLPQSVQREYDSTELLPLLAASTFQSVLGSPELALQRKEMGATIEAVLDEMTPREAIVIRMKYGMGGEEEHTLQEIGRAIGVSPERARQIHNRALRRLRNPRRTEIILSAALPGEYYDGREDEL